MYLVVLASYVAGLAISASIGGDGTFVDRAQRIIASEQLYRLGLVCSVVGTLSTIVLAAALYVTTEPINRNLALIGLLFRTAESAIGAVGVVLSFITLQLRLAVAQPGAFQNDQLAALASLITSAPTTEISAIFFSIGSTIFFFVFLRSTYIPRLLSAWGVFASLCYAALWVTQLILPESSGLILYGSLPILVAELSAALWLLIRGIHTATVTA